MSENFQHIRHGRRPANLIGLAGTGALLLLLIIVGAHPVFLVVLAIPALALCVEIYRDVHSFLTLSATEIRWGRNGKDSQIGFEDIEEVRLLRRLDFSQVVELRLAKGQKFRLPYDVTPPIPAFDAALRARGVRVTQHAFSLS